MVSVWAELNRRNVVKVAVAYAIVAWILAQLAEFATGTFGAPDWVLQIFVVFLILGFPLALIFAWAYELTPAGLMRTKDVPLEDSITQHTGQRLNYLLVGLLAGALIGSVTVSFLDLDTDVRQAREETIREIRRLMQEENDYAAAFALAQDALAIVPDDPTLASLWQEVSIETSVTTTPPGAEVYMKGYAALDADWTHIGQTSIDEVSLPRTDLRWRVEMEGFDTVERSYNPGFGPLHISLTAAGSIPPRMVQIPPSELRLTLTGYDYQTRIPAAGYLIDRYEVTNAEYMDFVDAGGYSERAYWQHEFIDGGATVSWEEAMSRFEDATGRTGPATWQGGTYPAGEADHPVGGISWYEAAAYAEFRGKTLPTVYHWLGPGGTYDAAEITALSNFDGAGSLPVGASEALSLSGTYDMAGNVKEWVSNSAGENRYILGGSWEDPAYRYTYPETRPPFDRSPTNGFRCVVYPGDQPIDERLSGVIDLPDRSEESLRPVDDETFQFYLARFDYERAPLEAVEDSNVQDAEHWRREKVTFNAAYGNERMSAYLYLPRDIEPPYQTVVYFPGTEAIHAESIDSAMIQYNMRFIDFIVQSGRALVWPIYKSTIDRRDGLTSTWPSPTRAFSDHVVQWVNDTSRTIDYLESRDDIDTSKLAYYGFSWGGRMGARVAAVEKRFSAVVLVAGALALSDARPDANQVNYAPRITAPVLMLNGRLDFIEPVDTAQRPLFELLGTPESDKRHVIFEDAGHTILPRSEMMEEILGWLDRYLGPVD